MSVDLFRREVKPKSKLEKTWTHQLNCTARREALKEWLNKNVCVVDEHGEW